MMHKLFIFTLIALAILIVGLVWADELTISTYYPAPYGVYKELNAYYFDFKNDKYQEGVDMPDHEEARICYDSFENVLKYSDGENWQILGEAPASYWTLDGDNLYTNDSSDPGTTWKVGIGTTSPNTALTVNGAIARVGSPIANQLHGNNAHTHKNLASSGGVTGTPGLNQSGCAVLGGKDNTASNSYAVVVGGLQNTASGPYNDQISGGATVLGGESNTASGDRSSVVAGGKNNTASGVASGVAGGENNTASGFTAEVLGGRDNTASGDYAIVLGGELNEATGFSSLAAGYRAKAAHPGSFVWADSTNADYISQDDDTFNVRATGGVYFTTDEDLTPWDIGEEMFVLRQDDVQEAELLSLYGNDILSKTKQAYDENLVGVVTSERTTSLHLQMSQDLTKENLEKRYVTLAGRVYVKVNKQNGPIKIGHPITSSSQAGIGMRADKPCKIIGYAMEDANFDQDNNAQILVFINLGYYVPQSAFQELEQRLAQLEQALK